MEAVGTDLPVKILQVAGSESTLPAKIHRSFIRVKVCFRESREIRIDRSLLGFDYSDLTGILPFSTLLDLEKTLTIWTWRSIMEKYRNALKKLENKHAQSLSEKYGLTCKQMQYGENTAALYIAKKNWTNRFERDREKTIGIFYCVWVSPELLEEEKYAYNIHSLKLRDLPGYKLSSREFANEFRATVKSRVASWPNISMDYGPLTLLEGRDVCKIATFDQKVEKRISDFVEIHEEIDTLLHRAAK